MELFKKKEPLEIIQDKVETYNAALTEATEALEAAENKVADAKIALETAADQNDATAFSAAKKQLADAETALEMATMRKKRLVEKGAVPQAEITAAIKSYENQIFMINAKACKEIIERLTALNEAIELANNEAKQFYWKEKKLCELVGIDFKPVMGSHTTGSYIAASLYRSWPSTNSLKTNLNLQRFAAQVKS